MTDGGTSEKSIAVDKATIQEIVRRILDVTKPDRIIIFGSAATGKMTRDSDTDILVVERDPGDRRKKSVRIHHALRGLGYRFDVIVISSLIRQSDLGCQGNCTRIMNASCPCG